MYKVFEVCSFYCPRDIVEHSKVMVDSTLVGSAWVPFLGGNS